MAATPARSAGAKKRRRKEFLIAMAFMSPFTIGFLVFLLYPVLASLYYSFCDYHIMRSPVWAGMANYRHLLEDAKFIKALGNTLYMLVIGVPLTNIVALLLAELLNQDCPLKGVFRTMIYVPSVMPVIAVSLVWMWVLNPDYGLMNAALQFLGLPKLGWLSDARWSKPALLMISTWSVGNTMVMYLAALQDVPHELYEAAAIDGAGPISQFFNVTVPSIKPVILYNVIVSLVGFMQYFTQGYVANATVGGAPKYGTPLNSTLFFATYLYQNAFAFYKVGYASAMAWILMLLTLAATIILIRSTGMFKSND